MGFTVRLIEAEYADSGRGRHRFSVRSMLLALPFTRFEAIPSVRKLCRRLEKRPYSREICEFGNRTPGHTTFSRFIARLSLKTLRSSSRSLEQAFRMGIIDSSGGYDG